MCSGHPGPDRLLRASGARSPDPRRPHLHPPRQDSPAVAMPSPSLQPAAEFTSASMHSCMLLSGCTGSQAIALVPAAVPWNAVLAHCMQTMPSPVIMLWGQVPRTAFCRGSRPSWWSATRQRRCCVMQQQSHWWCWMSLGVGHPPLMGMQASHTMQYDDA